MCSSWYPVIAAWKVSPLSEGILHFLHFPSASPSFWKSHSLFPGEELKHQRREGGLHLITIYHMVSDHKIKGLTVTYRKSRHLRTRLVPWFFSACLCKPAYTLQQFLFTNYLYSVSTITWLEAEIRKVFNNLVECFYFTSISYVELRIYPFARLTTEFLNQDAFLFLCV